MSQEPDPIPVDADELLLEAVRMFGPVEGRRFMNTRNFALGGRTPAELALTEEGARQVRNELWAQQNGGPL
jgi:uncharacterized protein (DUF2384 family)